MNLIANTIDRALLRRSNVAVDASVSERVFFLPVGADRCWVDLYHPTGERRSTGFVVCHAYGLELLWLHRIERAISRALASQGYPVLALHRRGFGDSSGSLKDASIARQTEDVLAAADHLADETGVSSLGLIAGRFGSVIAASVMGERPVERAMLMNPVVDSAAYFRSLIRDSNVISLAMGTDDEPPSVQQALSTMEENGMIDVLGQPIYHSLYEQAGRVDVRSLITAAPRDVLLCQIQKRSSPGRDVRELAEAVTSARGQCTVEVVREPTGGSFGFSSQARSASGTVLREVLRPVETALAEVAVGWMRS